MSDVTGGEVDVVGPDQWDAIALWLRQHPRGPELLDALAVAVPADPAEVLERFLWALGVPAAQVPGGTDGRQALYRSLLARRRALIVLDNASDERQVRPLLPGGTSCLVIVTSRLTLGALSVAEHLILQTLSPAESVRLLGRLAGAERVAAEPLDTERVARYCGYLPLALRIAGARLRIRPGWRVADLAVRLADERRRLDELHVGDLDARSSFTLSYRDLDAALARAFRLLSVIPGLDFGVSAAAAVLEAGEAAAEDMLENLASMALLETPAAGRYGFHDLIRLFAREHLPAEPDAGDSALHRVLTFYRDTAKEWLDQALGEYQPHPGALRWFDADGMNVLDAAEAAYAHGDWVIVTDLASCLHHLLAHYGRSTELQRLLSLAASAAGQAGDTRREVHSTILLAEKMVWRGEASQTLGLYERSLLLADQLGDPGMRAWVFVHNGDALRELGESGQARRAYEEALSTYESLSDVSAQAWVLTHLAGALHDLGELDQAEHMYREALGIADGQDNTGFRAWIQTHLCWTLADLSRWDEASDALDAALVEHRRTKDLVAQERDLQFLGKLHVNRASAVNSAEYYQKAAESYREAAEIADRRGDSFAADEWIRAANWAEGQATTAEGTVGYHP